MENKRIRYVDFIKGFAMLTVIFLHVHSGYNTDGKISEYLLKWITSFHMPLFFVCSGYFFKYEVKSYKKKITGKCKALLIPYIIWGILIGVLLVSIRAIVKGSSVDWGTLFWKIITLRQSFLACWFLKVLFRRVYVRILYSIYF